MQCKEKQKDPAPLRLSLPCDVAFCVMVIEQLPPCRSMPPLHLDQSTHKWVVHFHSLFKGEMKVRQEKKGRRHQTVKNYNMLVHGRLYTLQQYDLPGGRQFVYARKSLENMERFGGKETTDEARGWQPFATRP